MEIIMDNQAYLAVGSERHWKVSSDYSLNKGSNLYKHDKHSRLHLWVSEIQFWESIVEN